MTKGADQLDRTGTLFTGAFVLIGLLLVIFSKKLGQRATVQSDYDEEQAKMLLEKYGKYFKKIKK